MRWVEEPAHRRKLVSLLAMRGLTLDDYYLEDLLALLYDRHQRDQ